MARRCGQPFGQRLTGFGLQIDEHDLGSLSDESFDEASHIEKLLRDPKVARDLAAPEADE